MYDSTIKFKLQEQWKWINNEWREIFARNLKLDEYFTQKDLDYILTIEELDCSESKLNDLTPLYLMPQLRHLELRDVQLTDYTPISSLSELRELSAVFCSISNTSVLAGLSNLEVLDLSYPLTDTVDLGGLKGLTQLREIYCNACNGISLFDIMYLPCLEVVSFYFTQQDEEELSMFRKMHPRCQILY